MLAIKQETIGKSLILSLTGRLEHCSIQTIEDLIVEIESKGHLFVIMDMTTTNFISSYGFRVILLLREKLLQQNGRLVICNVPDDIMHIICIAGFDQIFELSDDKESAVNFINSVI